jgi:hypothetical protein
MKLFVVVTEIVLEKIIVLVSVVIQDLIVQLDNVLEFFLMILMFVIIMENVFHQITVNAN